MLRGERASNGRLDDAQRGHAGEVGAQGCRGHYLTCSLRGDDTPALTVAHATTTLASNSSVKQRKATAVAEAVPLSSSV